MLSVPFLSVFSDSCMQRPKLARNMKQQLHTHGLLASTVLQWITCFKLIQAKEPIRSIAMHVRYLKVSSVLNLRADMCRLVW